MFVLAIFLGIYTYGFFFFGLFGLLYGWIIILWTIFVLSLGFLISIPYLLKHFLKIRITNEILKKIQNDNKIGLTLVLLLALVLVNLIGVLGPETSFDALWYHLTFPKLYLQNHSITYIPGGLLYYSVMPKLGELLFVPALFFGNEIIAKLLQYLFGILTTVVIFKISRRYFSLSLSLLACLVFYSNIVVSWESTVAYIDLVRAFYETMTLWAFLIWSEKQKRAWLYLSAIMLGFAISTKVLALGSLTIFTSLIVYLLIKKKKITVISLTTNILVYWYISIVVVVPWFLFSYFSTRNAFYPFFTPFYPVASGQNIHALLSSFLDLFLFSHDPISPIYLIVLPLVIVFFSKLKSQHKIIGYYCLGSLIVWYITPNTGGGRFILPYLPAWSILVIAILDQVKRQKILYRTVAISIFLIAIVTTFYRGIANSRYIPVILGKETKQEFLTKHLDFSFGDFYDTDGYFKTHITDSDKVLLYGFHNLYYIDFSFVDASWVKKGDRFTYIATQHTSLPKRFKQWQLVYENPITFVKLYRNTKKQWIY